MAAINLYEILGVARDATPEEIKHAYRKSAQSAHPDKNPGDEAAAAERMAAINMAYGTLSDAAARAHYDETGELEKQPDPIDLAAVSCLTDLFGEALAGDVVDVVRFCRQSAQQRIDGCIHEIKRADGMIATQRRKRDRVKSKTELNLYHGLIDANIEALEKTKEANARLKEVLVRSIKLLDDYESAEASPQPDVGLRTLGNLEALIDDAFGSKDRRRRSPFYFGPGPGGL